MTPVFKFDKFGEVKSAAIDGVRGRRLSNFGRSVYRFDTKYILKIDDKLTFGNLKDPVYSQTLKELKNYAKFDNLEKMFFPKLIGFGIVKPARRNINWMITEYIPKSQVKINDWQIDVIRVLTQKYDLIDITIDEYGLSNCLISKDGRPIIVDAAL